MCERGKLTLDTTILATISLHALARRLARGWDNSIDTILGEFKLIAGRADTLIEAAGEFAVAVPDGRWVGKVIEAVRSEDRSELCLRIQTFKHA